MPGREERKREKERERERKREKERKRETEREEKNKTSLCRQYFQPTNHHHHQPTNLQGEQRFFVDHHGMLLNDVQESTDDLVRGIRVHLRYKRSTAVVVVVAVVAVLVSGAFNGIDYGQHHRKDCTNRSHLHSRRCLNDGGLQQWAHTSDKEIGREIGQTGSGGAGGLKRESRC